MKRVLVPVLAGVLAAPVAAPLAFAQEVDCFVPQFRGATLAAGAQATMTVRNNGRPCALRVFTDIADQTPYDRMAVTKQPGHGRVDVSQPPYVRYRPAPGFTGTDSFEFEGDGKTQRLAPVHMRVAVTVTVNR